MSRPLHRTTMWMFTPAYVLLMACLAFAGAEINRHYWKNIHSDQEYFQALRQASREVFAVEFEFPFLTLLNDQQKEFYQKLPNFDRKKRFIELYWALSNPNPLLPENDWLMTFIQRCRYVEEHFAISDPPYFDDRAIFFLKYGQPTNRYEDKGGIYFIDTYIYNLMKKIYLNSIIPTRHYLVSANESWAYENFDPPFLVHFVKSGEKFTIVENLYEAIKGGSQKSLAWYWMDLIKKRGHTSQIFGETLSAIEDFERHLIQEMDEYEAQLKDSAKPLPDSIDSTTPILLSFNPPRPEQIMDIQPHSSIFLLRADHQSRERYARIRLPGATFVPIRAFNRIAFEYHVSQFKESWDKTRLEITYLAPVEGNLVARDKASEEKAPERLEVLYASLFRDRIFRPLIQDKRALTVNLKKAHQQHYPNVVGLLSLTVPPQPGELTLQIQNVNSEEIGFVKIPIQVRNFQSQRLSLSDLQFYFPVNPQDVEDFLPVVERSGLQVTPYPFSQVRKSLPLITYLEIYNLQYSGVESEYRVSYSIFRDKEKEHLFQKMAGLISGSPKISISITNLHPVTGNNATEILTFDLSRLATGPYIMEVKVEDARGSGQEATMKREFILID